MGAVVHAGSSVQLCSEGDPFDMCAVYHIAIPRNQCQLGPFYGQFCARVSILFS